MQIGKIGLVALLAVILITGGVTAYNFYTIGQLNQKIDELTVNINALILGEVFKDIYGNTILVIPQNVTVPDLPVIIVRAPTQRIVSFAPSITETLFSMGLGDRVVAVTKWCDWPQEMVDRKNAGNLTVLTSITDPEVEMVVAANPDLILVPTIMEAEGVAKLKALGLPVVGVDYGKSLEDIYNAIKLIGKLTGAKDNSENLVSELKQNITRVYNAVANLPKPKVFWMIWHEPLMSAGGPSFINALIQTAGGVNIFEGVNIAWPFVSSEEVLLQNPDVIIFTEGFKEFGVSNVDDLLDLFPAWSEIKAVKEEKVFAVPDFFVHAGPRTAEAIEILAELIHQIEI